MAREHPDSPASLVLVRHGETTWNAAGLIQGHSDRATLTDTGLGQARQLADDLGAPGAPSIRALYSSDLRRSRSTAEPLSGRLGLALRIDARLRERCYGAVEGEPLSRVDVQTIGIDQGRVLDPDARPPGGESLRDLYLRTASFLDELFATPPRGGEGDVVAVTHGGTIRVALAYLQGIPVEEMSWPPVPNLASYRRALGHPGRPTPATGSPRPAERPQTAPMMRSTS
ncbi:MAG: histidine phosphatase family protein [Acidimicrobiales bacterium]|nr:histidine phosphatase family protein [Acidimicrobiales bacterium]MBO0893458.1 histidine phosphatase family protein [Acidimicrobiales bacterium]